MRLYRTELQEKLLFLQNSFKKRFKCDTILILNCGGKVITVRDDVFFNSMMKGKNLNC